jgi:hypothetical protein
MRLPVSVRRWDPCAIGRRQRVDQIHDDFGGVDALLLGVDLFALHNLRRGHYELGVELPRAVRVAAAFTELAQAI